MVQSCLNCGEPVAAEFCDSCGQKATVSRITFPEIFRGFWKRFVDLDSVALRTFKGLLVNPGAFIRDYLNGRRKPYVNPLRYFLVILAINIASSAILGSPAFNPVRVSGDMLFAQLSLTIQFSIAILFLLYPVSYSLKAVFFKSDLSVAECYTWLLYSMSQVAMYIIVIQLLISPFSEPLPIIMEGIVLSVLIGLFLLFSAPRITSTSPIASTFGVIIALALTGAIFKTIEWILNRIF